MEAPPGAGDRGPGRIAVLKDVPLGNGNWLIEVPGRRRAVLRRYHPGASPEDLAYEHAVLAHLAAAGWVVPHPVSDPVSHDGLWYCLTRAELTRSGWPLTALEEAAIKPVYHAFRLDMAAWEIHYGLRTGQCDLTAIERQLSRTGTTPP
jgi:hypothetical protein